MSTDIAHPKLVPAVMEMQLLENDGWLATSSLQDYTANELTLLYRVSDVVILALMFLVVLFCCKD